MKYKRTRTGIIRQDLAQARAFWRDLLARRTNLPGPPAHGGYRNRRFAIIRDAAWITLYRATLPFPQVGVFLRCAGLAGEAFFTLADVRGWSSVHDQGAPLDAAARSPGRGGGELTIDHLRSMSLRHVSMAPRHDRIPPVHHDMPLRADRRRRAAIGCGTRQPKETQMKTLTSIVRTWSTVAVLTVSLVAGAGGEARAAGSFLSSPEPARGSAIQTSRGPAFITGSIGSMQTTTLPGSAAQGLLMNNGNGTSTMIVPGSVPQVVATPR